MPSIKISPKHGLNPTISVCFFCGKEKNEIALLGRLKDDVEAPKNAVIDYEPCDECKAKFNQGITFIAVATDGPDGRPPIQVNKTTGTRLYPTGDIVVVKEEAVRNLPIPKDLLEHVLKTKKCLMYKTTFDSLFKQALNPAKE